MTAQCIDGKKFAINIRNTVKSKIKTIKEKHDLVPGLAVILVGSDPASQIYVRSKSVQTVDIGMGSYKYELPETSSQEEVLSLIESLNDDPLIHGILVQLPLPQGIDEFKVINAISTAKDVDGFNTQNVGLLSTGQQSLVPCTPLGCLKMLKAYHDDLTGLNAVIVGRSNIVGKPIAQLLLSQNCTVTVAHSKTRNLPQIIQTADILVAAVGRAEMIKGEWIKPGATIIDVGINRIENANGKKELKGDVHFSAAEVAGAITPVPGGVGPMTIACLLENTFTAFCRIEGFETTDNIF